MDFLNTLWKAASPGTYAGYKGVTTVLEHKDELLSMFNNIKEVASEEGVMGTAENIGSLILHPTAILETLIQYLFYQFSVLLLV